MSGGVGDRAAAGGACSPAAGGVACSPAAASGATNVGRTMDWSAPFGDLSVGQRFRSAPREVSEQDVMAFCALTGDWHPQHCDARWAASTPFGERIAHGMLVLSFAIGLVPLDPLRVKALRRVGGAVFKRPVRLGEQISVAGEVSGLKRIDPAVGLVGFRWSIANGDGALVCRACVEVLWGDGAVDEGSGGEGDVVPNGVSGGEGDVVADGVSGGEGDVVADGVSGGEGDVVVNGVSGEGDVVADGVSGGESDVVVNGVSGGGRRLRDEPFWREAVPDAVADARAFVPVPM